jgi:hypothetical protein
MAKDKQRIGIAGELLVASKLTELGLTVGVTRKNTPGIDILVSDGKTAKIVQVKTTENSKQKPIWVCKNPKSISNDVIYVFVILKNGAVPSFFVVPCKEVKKTIDRLEVEGRKKYIKKNGKEPPLSPRGVAHFKDENFIYKDKWENMGLTLEKAPSI